MDFNEFSARYANHSKSLNVSALVNWIFNLVTDSSRDTEYFKIGGDVISNDGDSIYFYADNGDKYQMVITKVVDSE